MKETFPRPRLFILLLSLALVSCVTAAPTVESPDLERLRAQAEGGDTASQYRLGLRYTNGQEVAQDYAAAAEWYARAAEGGHAGAQYMLGVAYYAGRGVISDQGTAVAWFENAAAQGHVRAMYQLGDAYTNGRGVAKEAAWATRWFNKAAMGGHREAQFAAGVAAAAGMGQPVDRIEAWKWLKLADDGGHEEAGAVLERVASGMNAVEIERALDLALDWKEGLSDDFADAPTVRFVQQALTELGYDPGPVDGIAGPATAKGVLSYLGAAVPDSGPAITRELVERLRGELSTRSAAEN